jgi:hypothetical protein
MDQTLLNIVFSGGMAVLGWLGKTIWEANKELRADLSKLREELPIDYVRKEDIEKRFDKIDMILHRIYEKLDNKADKHDAR